MEVELSDYLREVRVRQFNAGVPPPVAHRADQLVELLLQHARTLGTVTRGELVAALIHTAPTETAMLRGKIEEYREAQVWETILGARRRKGKYVFTLRGRGRPTRS